MYIPGNKKTADRAAVKQTPLTYSLGYRALCVFDFFFFNSHAALLCPGKSERFPMPYRRRVTAFAGSGWACCSLLPTTAGSTAPAHTDTCHLRQSSRPRHVRGDLAALETRAVCGFDIPPCGLRDAFAPRLSPHLHWPLIIWLPFHFVPPAHLPRSSR